MDRKKPNPAKEVYQRLRLLSCEELWTREVAAFDRADARERMDTVGVIRAVGVVFAESGSEDQRRQARAWLRQLLNDPQEKIRRYAMTALPKLGAEESEESALLDLLERPASERERKALGSALEKIGGAVTLARTPGRDGRIMQKVQANLARTEEPGALRWREKVRESRQLEIRLRCRRGLEGILGEEAKALCRRTRLFRPIQQAPGLVTLEAMAPFSLADVWELRCFSSAGLVLGATDVAEDLAKIIAGERAQHLLKTFTDGPVRYRLEYSGQGHRRSAVRTVTDRVFKLCPSLLNDSRGAPWQIDIHQQGKRLVAELSPRLRPDPRFAYRLEDVPAASHPPLAAAMAWLAGPLRDAVVWDPFCGSGLELIECARRGGVQRVAGTDLSEAAVEIASANFEAALGKKIERALVCGDFRNHDLGAESVSLVVTNPPMGRRVPIADLPGLISDLFAVAKEVLRPGGHLVFANPLAVRPNDGTLRKEFRQKIDLGGFHVHLEKYRRQ